MNKATVTITCPKCEEEIKVGWSYDPGCMYTKNGDGWPPSEEVDTDHWCGELTEAEQKLFNDRLNEAISDLRDDNEPDDWWEERDR